jgi:thiamine biosynthesis lipoprotein
MSTPHLTRWLLCALLPAVLCACGRAPVEYRDSRPLMGTQVDIVLEGTSRADLQDASDAAYREMTRLSNMMNHYDPNSVVSAINNAAGQKPVRVPPELMEVLKMARATSQRTQGAFDITIGSLRGWRFDPQQPAMPTPAQIRTQLPLVDYRHLVLDETAQTAYLTRPGMRIDLGGIAKLYILDAGKRVLAARGVKRAMLNGGGDVEVMGGTTARPWHVGIRDPRVPSQLFAVLDIDEGFVASSGDYERYFFQDGKRYHHILNPKTGYPTTGLRHVTLVSRDLNTVNGISAAVMVLGMTQGRTLIESTPGLQGLLIDADGTVWVSPELAAHVRSPAPH